MDHQRELIQESFFKEGPNDGRAAGDPDVLSRLLLQALDLGTQRALDQGRVHPLDLFQRGRGDIFRRVVDVAGIRFIRRGGPVAGPLLIGHSPQQHGVLFVEMRLHRRQHVGVEQIELPLVWRFHDPVERNEQPRYYFPHIASLVWPFERGLASQAVPPPNGCWNSDRSTLKSYSGARCLTRQLAGDRRSWSTPAPSRG